MYVLYYSQTWFRDNSCILLHLFIQKPCNNDFESCWLWRLCAEAQVTTMGD